MGASENTRVRTVGPTLSSTPLLPAAATANLGDLGLVTTAATLGLPEEEKEKSPKEKTPWSKAKIRYLKYLKKPLRTPENHLS